MIFRFFVRNAVQDDLQVLCQERSLPQSCLQGIIIVDRLLKDLTVRKEVHRSAAFIRSAFSDHCDRGDDLSSLKLLLVDLSFTAHLDCQPPPPNLPPACRMVKTTSRAEIPAFF